VAGWLKKNVYQTRVIGRCGANFLVRSRSVYINRGESVSAQPFGTRGPSCRLLLHSGTTGASVGRVRSVPDVDYCRMPADLRAGERTDPDAAGEWLARAWTASCRTQVPDSMLLEFEDVATFLFDQACGAGAVQADRTIAAWGFARSGRRPRDAAYQRGYPSPAGRAERPLDKGHMVAHSAGGEFGPNIFPQDRALNRGWSAEGNATWPWNGRSRGARGHSSAAACCMPTTATSRRRSSLASSGRPACTSNGSLTASTCSELTDIRSCMTEAVCCRDA